MKRRKRRRAAETYTLSFSRVMKIVMTPFLTGPRFCSVRLSADRLKVKMGPGGWAFSASLPRSAIVSSEQIRGPVWAWGAHGWRGRWLVNGSSRGLVQLTLDPPGRGRCVFVRVKVRELTLSLDQPDEFLAAIH